MVRFNATASNLVMHQSVLTAEQAYKGKRPVFEALLLRNRPIRALSTGGVKVAQIVDDQTPNERIHNPGKFPWQIKTVMYIVKC